MSLEYHGFEVETFNDPRKALSNFKTDYYNLIILEHQDAKYGWL
jgi:hypothetical protein